LEEDLEEIVVVKKVDFPLLQEETDDDKFVEETIINTKQQRGQGEKESERVWCECALASFERDSQQKKSGCFCEKS
jgi:hypothetical protein